MVKFIFGDLKRETMITSSQHRKSITYNLYDIIKYESSRSSTDEQKEENDIKTLIDELSCKSRKSSMTENHVRSIFKLLLFTDRLTFSHHLIG